MAFLHCHSCNWSQDDFYSKSYNPLTKIWNDIKYNLKPRIISWDLGFIKYDLPQLKKYTGMPVYFKENKCFSWNWLLLEIIKDIKITFKMKWWTYKSWVKDMNKGKAKCPQCKQINFDID